jgi:ABC-2 type transport system permease protein
MAFLMMFFAPAFTMRLISDELRAGTHELLFTAPVRDWEIVVGKWLGAWGVMTILIIITLLFPLVLFLGGNPDPGPIIAGYIGFWLWTGSALALGVLTSSTTQHQLVAYIGGFFLTLFLWLAYLVNQVITTPVINDIFTQLTVTNHYHDTMLQRGIIDPVDVAYFLGIMAISLFIGTQILSTRRWRP